MKRLVLFLLMAMPLQAAKAVATLTPILDSTTTVAVGTFDVRVEYKRDDGSPSNSGVITVNFTDTPSTILAAARTKVIALCGCGLVETDIVVFGQPLGVFGAALNTAASTASTIPATALPLPGASAPGGVRSITCPSTNKLSAIGTDGIAVCSADQGADPWTYLVLGSDFTTSSGSAVDVTGLAFTPSANLRYQISGHFLMRAATATVVPRLGIAWPTGMTDGTSVMTRADTATSLTFTTGNINASLLQAVGGLANNTQSWPSTLEALVVAGASPSGTFKVQLASETAATNVTLKAGSYIRYRTY